MAIDKKFIDGLSKQYGNVFADGRGEVISTGILGVDLITHDGINMGSIHEFYGLSKTGKSLGMQLIAIQAQKADKNTYVIILDRENAYDEQRTASLGLDPARTIIIPSRHLATVERAYEVITDMMQKFEAAVDDSDGKKAGEIGRNYRKTKSPNLVFLIDSMPAFAESEAYVEDMGRRAKAWHSIFRRLTAALDPRIMILVSNHITYSPSAYGSGETKTTGIAIDYYRDCGIKYMKIADMLDEDDRKIGVWMGAEVEKTRRGAMYARTFFPVYYKQQPINYYSGVLPYCQYLGIAELANKSTWAKDKGKKAIWPNFKCCDKAINEKDPAKLKAFIEENDLLAKIKVKEAELFG